MQFYKQIQKWDNVNATFSLVYFFFIALKSVESKCRTKTPTGLKKIDLFSKVSSMNPYLVIMHLLHFIIYLKAMEAYQGKNLLQISNWNLGKIAKGLNYLGKKKGGRQV